MLFPEKEIALKDGRSACLRSPTTEDAAEMLAYLKDCASETHFILREPEECTETPEQEAAYLERVSTSDTSVMIVCSVGQEIAGNCQLSFHNRSRIRHRAEIAIALRQKYWGLGIGTAMFREMIALAQARGVTQLELGFVEGNARARGLYEKMGFRIVFYHPNAFRLKDGTLLGEYWMLRELYEARRRKKGGNLPPLSLLFSHVTPRRTLLSSHRSFVQRGYIRP